MIFSGTKMMNDALQRTVLICSLLFAWYSPYCNAQWMDDTFLMDQISLGTPPRDPGARLHEMDGVTAQELAVQGPVPAAEVDGFSVTPSVRHSVVSFYENIYLPVFFVAMNWTGNPATCNAGNTSQAYIDASFNLINYYRAMVELPTVSNDASKNDSSQKAALMMSVNNSLDHSPPPEWQCYTAAGASAAGSSNLALGAAGPRAIDLYIRDPGSFNTAVGHRRWILHPPRSSFGIGSVGGATRDANALWVFAGVTSRPPADIVAWPPRGFVPFRLVYPRWSFSLNSEPGANYSSATVSMLENGVPITLAIVSNNTNGYGDNTLVWEPAGLVFSPGQTDRSFDIVISNLSNADQSEYAYRVTVIDPAMDPPAIFSDSFE